MSSTETSSSRASEKRSDVDQNDTIQSSSTLSPNLPTHLNGSTSPAVPVTTDRTFTLFPKLPIELRLIVWEMALPGPRILKSSLTRTTSGDTCWDLRPSEKSPALLFTCQESRAVAEKSYKPVSLRWPKITVQHVNPSTDIIFVVGELNFYDPWPRIAQQIPDLTRIAISEVTFDIFIDQTAPRLAGFTSLEELILILNEDGRASFEDVSHIKTFEGNCQECPMEHIWGWKDRVRASFKPYFTKFERDNADWKTPTIRSGRFVKGE